MAGDFSTNFELGTIAQGQLEQDFQDKYRDVINSLKKGQKGSITIKIELSRPADMDSLVNTSYELSISKPKKKVASIAAIAEDKQEQLFLKTDAPPKVNYSNVTILEKQKEAK